MKVTLIFGFLGAGKTTLLRGLLPQLARRERIGILVNEFGAVGIDGALLSTGQVAVREMASGCICCALLGDLARALMEIHAGWNPDRLLIEPTGLAAPEPLGQLFAVPPISEFAVVDRVVTVVDAPRFLPSRDGLADFYREQIRHADALVLNKIDRVSPEELAGIDAALHRENPAAEIRPVTYARVPVDWLEGDGRPRPLTAPRPKHAHAEDMTAGLAAHSLSVRRTTTATLRALAPRLDAGEFGEVVRAKGFIESEAGAVLVQYVPGALTLEAYAGEQRAFVVTGRNVRAAALAAALHGE